MYLAPLCRIKDPGCRISQTPLLMTAMATTAALMTTPMLHEQSIMYILSMRIFLLP